MTYGPRALSLLQQLKALRATEELLKATGLGRLVARYLRHESTTVASEAKTLLQKWARRTVRTVPCSDDDSEAEKKEVCEPGSWSMKQARLLRRTIFALIVFLLYTKCIQLCYYMT